MRKLRQLLAALIIFAGALILPKISLAATLYMSPGSGSFGVGSSFTVRVLTNTQGDAVNSAEAEISFTTDTLELVRVSAGPTFTLQTPGSPSKTSSSASFSGGLPTPGYNGNSGVVGVMTFRAKKEGAASVSVSSGKVLLNDGQGTDALNGKQSGNYTITPPAAGAPEVSSTNEPDQTKWYAKNLIDLSWTRPSNAYGFSFILDQNPNTEPDDTLDTTVTTTQNYPNPADGVWYFHIKARGKTSGFGPTTTFKIQIDNTSPKSFNVTLAGQTNLNNVNNTPTIEFNATDDMSGLDHYSIYLDDTGSTSLASNLKTDKATSPYTFNELSGGPHIIKVIAYDKAGNTTSAQLPIVITGAQQVTEKVTTLVQTKLQIPVIALLIINGLMFLIILVLLYLLLVQRKKQKQLDPILNLQSEVDKSLESLKEHINKELAKYAKKTGVKNAVITEEIDNDITDTKGEIEKKLGSVRRRSKPE